MDRQKRTELVEAKKAELTETLDAHVSALELLDTTTSFDFDIATDIHPELIDNTTPDGRARLKFWQNLYDGLSENPKYTVVKRYATDLKPGCYGFGKEADYEVTKAWVRVYTDLSQEALQFSRNEEGNAEVTINAPSFLLSGTNRNDRLLEAEADAAIFLSEEQSRIGVTRIAPEYTHEPTFFFMNDVVELLYAHSDIMQSNLPGESLPIEWSAFTAQEKLNDPRFQIHTDN